MNTDQYPKITRSSYPGLVKVGWTLGSVLSLWLLSWLAVPPLLTSQLETRLIEQLGRNVTVGHIDFRPWSLELALHDISVAAAKPEATAQLSIKRLYIDMALQSLLRMAPVVDAISLESPHLRLTHLGDGHYDVDDVLAKLTTQPDQPKAAEASPLRFALYNLSLADGAVEFLDAPKEQAHHLSQLQISLPFLSNMDSQRDVQTQPKLAFDLNGSRFDSSANTTPFAQTHKTDAQLLVKDLDLKPYLVYWPAGLPVRLTSAKLNADVKVAFEQAVKTSVTLSGQVSASGVTVASISGIKPVTHSTADSALLAFERLSIELKAVQPLLHDVQLGRIAWTNPHLMLHRNRAGVLNASKIVASNAGMSGATAKKDTKPANPDVVSAWQLGVDSFDIQGGEVMWRDETTTPAAQLNLTALAFQAQSLAWPIKQPVPFAGSAHLGAAALDFKGQASDQALDSTLKVADLPLSLAAPYVAQFLTPALNGLAKAALTVNWTAAKPGQHAQTRLQVPSLTLDQLALVAGKKSPLAGFRQVQLNDVTLDLGRQSATVGRLLVTQPRAGVSRSEDGRWMFQDWLKNPLEQSAPSSEATQNVATSAKPEWQLAVNDLQLLDGGFSFLDKAMPQPVALEATGVAVQIKNFSLTGQKPFVLNLAAHLRHGHTEPGSLSWRGNSSLRPLMLKGNLVAQRLPLHALAPYASDVLNVSLLRADTSFKGQVELTQQQVGLALRVAGDAALEDLQVRTLALSTVPAEDLLRWKSLNLTGLDLALSPGAAARVDVRGTVLSDFYAKLVLSDAGRLNLQDVIKPAEQVTPSVDQSRPQPAAPAPLIHLGPVSLLGGHVNFTDRFIQPNYSAELTELAGTLSALSSQAANGEVQLADLELRGRAQGSASLEVLGKINPLVKPLALDIQGKVRDLELAPLSTYSARYAGYGIERGKLSVDVAYKVQSDGQLTANNKIILNQLKFGDAVPNPVNSLPVKLAVALLADRNGVIDIDLPVSGSLNDPQFRLMPLVFKVIGNLIVKAITAPFSLLASALSGGGGDELSAVSFEAGSALLSDQAKAGLSKVAKALQDRPALKMTVVGTASLEVEREAYKRAQLQSLLQIEKRREQGSGAPATEKPAPVTLQEYPVLLKAVYKRADFPKPRNLLGLTKDIPVPDMEALLLVNLEASEPAMQALAVKRGVAVRDYLVSLKLPTERLFLGAAKAVAPDAKWQPQAELNLAIE